MLFSRGGLAASLFFFHSKLALMKADCAECFFRHKEKAEKNVAH